MADLLPTPTAAPAMLASDGLLLVGLAVLTKLACSADDVLWLMPFVAGRKDKGRNALVYLLCNGLVTSCAGLFSLGASTALEQALQSSSGKWGSSTVLEMIGGSLLLLYSLKLFRDFLAERAEAKEEAKAKEAEVEEAVKEEKAAEEKAADEEAREAEPAAEEGGAVEVADAVVVEVDPESDRKGSVRELVVICLFGSIDDCAVQASMLVSGTFLLPHLFAGVCLGALCVVAVCAGAGFVRPLLALVERIPLFVIVAALAAWSFTSALTEVYG